MSIGSKKQKAKRYSMPALMAAVSLAAVATLGMTRPSVAEVTGAQFGMHDHSLMENVSMRRSGGGGRMRAGRMGGARFGCIRGGGFRGGYAGRGGYSYCGGGGTAAVIAGAAAGAIISGAPAGQAYSQGYTGYGYPDASDSGYYGHARPVMTSAVGESVAYCGSHFRSFNPAGGTYLGFDGLEHACP